VAGGGVGSRIDFRLAPALETLDGLIADGQAGTFDFAFIDADKPNYPNYYERALTLLRPGGLIAADNVLWKEKWRTRGNGIPIRSDASFNRKLHADPRVTLSMATMGDGLTLACKLGR